MDSVMKDLPILFSGEMVRAILEGRKTMTRRLVTPQPMLAPPAGDWWYFGKLGCGGDMLDAVIAARSRFQVGRPMWVRERMRVIDVCMGPRCVKLEYQADGTRSGWIPYPARLADPRIGKCLAYGGHREASRLALRITAHRVERLHEITEEDARAEGVHPMPRPPRAGGPSYRATFAVLWDSLNHQRAPWSANPWIEVVSFERVAQ